MERTRKIAMVAATFFLAAATGQYMQSNAPRQDPSAIPHVVAAARGQAPVLRVQDTAAEASPSLPSAPAVPVLPALMPVVFDLPQDAGAAPALALAVAAAASCDPKLTLTPAPGAMLSLALEAACNGSERVVILADGLSFTGLTSDQGKLALSLPAMRDPARVTVRFAGGATVTAGAEVPELEQVNRVAVQWMGQDAFRLTALEFGADYGSAGAVSAENPRVPVAPAAARGGFLTVLGDASVVLPMLAQVYTVSKVLDTAGAVALEVEAPVTAATCGREMIGQMLVAGGAEASDVSLAMPDCEPAAMGQSVALEGLAPVLAVASR